MKSFRDIFVRIGRDLSFTIHAISADLNKYLELDPSVSKKWMVLFSSLGFYALLFYRISHLFWRWRIIPLSLIIYTWGKIVTSSDIHPAAEIEPGVVIDHGIGTVIGSTASVGTGTLIYHGVTLGAKRPVKGKRHPDVGRGVLLGTGAKILGPITIGDNAVVGANSVVLKDVPKGALVVGIPGRIVEEEEVKVCC